MQHLKDEAENMMKKIELLEDSRRLGLGNIVFSLTQGCLKSWLLTQHIIRKLLGENLGACTIDELQLIEQQLERSVTSIRARKVVYTANCLRVSVTMLFCLVCSFKKATGSNFLFFAILWGFQTQVFKEQIEKLQEKVCWHVNQLQSLSV